MEQTEVGLHPHVRSAAFSASAAMTAGSLQSEGKAEPPFVSLYLLTRDAVRALSRVGLVIWDVFVLWDFFLQCFNTLHILVSFTEAGDLSYDCQNTLGRWDVPDGTDTQHQPKIPELSHLKEKNVKKIPSFKTLPAGFVRAEREQTLMFQKTCSPNGQCLLMGDWCICQKVIFKNPVAGCSPWRRENGSWGTK